MKTNKNPDLFFGHEFGKSNGTLAMEVFFPQHIGPTSFRVYLAKGEWVKNLLTAAIGQPHNGHPTILIYWTHTPFSSSGWFMAFTGSSLTFGRFSVGESVQDILKQATAWHLKATRREHCHSEDIRRDNRSAHFFRGLLIRSIAFGPWGEEARWQI